LLMLFFLGVCASAAETPTDFFATSSAQNNTLEAGSLIQYPFVTSPVLRYAVTVISIVGGSMVLFCGFYSLERYLVPFPKIADPNTESETRRLLEEDDGMNERPVTGRLDCAGYGTVDDVRAAPTVQGGTSTNGSSLDQQGPPRGLFPSILSTRNRISSETFVRNSTFDGRLSAATSPAAILSVSVDGRVPALVAPGNAVRASTRFNSDPTVARTRTHRDQPDYGVTDEDTDLLSNQPADRSHNGRGTVVLTQRPPTPEEDTREM